MWNVAGMNLIRVIALVSLIGCGAPNGTGGLTDSDTSSDAYFSSLGLSWKNLDGSAITNPDQSDLVLECVAGSNSAPWCKSVCIADTLKFAATQERWTLYKSGYEGAGVCFMELFAYDRAREFPRFAHYSGEYFQVAVGGAMQGRCRIDLEAPEFTGAYRVNLQRQRVADTISWLNSDGTPYMELPLRSFNGVVFTVLDTRLQEEVTLQVKDGWDCFRRDSLQQSLVDSFVF